MTADQRGSRYLALASRELELAAASTSLLLKARHLDAAARLATLRERSAVTDRQIDLHHPVGADRNQLGALDV